MQLASIAKHVGHAPVVVNIVCGSQKDFLYALAFKGAIC